MRPKGVADGHAANIPQLLSFDKDRCGEADAKSVWQWFQATMNGDPESQVRRVGCQEKPVRRTEVSVPQTDTGGRDEYSQALG